MKKLILLCQVLLVLLFLTKALSHREGFRETTVGEALTWSRPVHAQTVTPPRPAPPRDVTDDGLQKERDLLALLQKREKALEQRELAVQGEEKRVQALKQELVEKIDRLKALEAQLGEKLDAEKSQEEKRLKELAKVYDATPPQKVAAMFEKLDVKTAAGITIHMKRERAGLVWGFLGPQKAVEITNEITRTARLATP